MKAYLAIGTWDWEGGQILGVYTKKKEAVKKIRSIDSKEYDTLGIEEIELDTDLEIFV